MTDSADLHPIEIPGYEGGPFGRCPEFLDDHLFWLTHLRTGVFGTPADDVLLGDDRDQAAEFFRLLTARAGWPTFTVPLRDEHRLHVVHYHYPDEGGVDYLVHHPNWAGAEILASDDGHFMGPGLCWPELIAAADNGLPGGSSTNPHARLLLLLPALGDSEVPGSAAARVAAALRDRTRVSRPEELAAALLARQNHWGPSRWSTTGAGVRRSHGTLSYRNPDNDFALPADRLAQISAALSP